MSAPAIVWFRQDLRLFDQAALAAAAAEGPVIAVYILDDGRPGRWRIGAAQRWWLHHSLAALGASFGEKRLKLILRRGDCVLEIARIVEETGASTVHALRHYEPWWVDAERELAKQVDLRLHDGNTLLPPEEVRNGSGAAYRVYTPFWNALSARLPPPEPQLQPSLSAPASWPDSDRLEDWDLLPRNPDWAAAFGNDWTPGEAGAAGRIEAFQVKDYADRRDRPGEEGTTRLSPHLHFGEISPATVWHQVSGAGADKFHKELAWRDFAQGRMLDEPELGTQHGRRAFDTFPWRSGGEVDQEFQAWSRGRTGYPIIDAGMRQLWTTGWMHNRVRMIAASFLVKHLLIDWRRGADWFWDTLVDADYGNNSLNWQWIAGTGTDSSPFARIMAPLVQSEKFDAEHYIRHWVPELAGLDGAALHDPHKAGAEVDYPPKLIGHREARERALGALASLR